jgi:hypothetical protein
MEEAAIGEEDAEGIGVFDDESISAPRLRLPLRKREDTVFREVQPIPVRREVRRAAQAPKDAAAKVANATGEKPAAGEELS